MNKSKLNKFILKQPANHVLIWQDRINNKLITVHRIEFKNTLSKSHYDLVYNKTKVGSGTKTKVLKRLLALIS